ncbi:MAG: alpha/beta fold hydrolase [Acidobacteria bacterium]|nr:MAG: alpha/beta fold hydrolase [Acidobacteriota bacterium]
MQNTSRLVTEQHLVEVGEGQAVGAILYRAQEPTTGAHLVLAHGAGAGQTSAFIRDFAAALAERGVGVLTFNFPYMEAKRRLPDRPEILENCFRATIDAMGKLIGAGSGLFIGGKSMGGRIASQFAARPGPVPLGLAGLVLLGYPLHPPGKPDQLRTGHLPQLKLPVLIFQGTRDVFGTPDELRPWFTGPGVSIRPVEGGDHSFKIPKSRGRDQEEVFSEIQDGIRDWVVEVAH